MDETLLHVLLDGSRLKTLPSRLGVTELALAADGARPAGPSPLASGTGTAIEVERLVNGTGLASRAGAQVNVGYELAGQKVTLRMDGTQMARRDPATHHALPGPSRRQAPAAGRPAGEQHPPGRPDLSWATI